MSSRFGVLGLSVVATIVLAWVFAGGPMWAAVCGDSTIEPPETCDPPGAPACDCCVDHGTPGCTNPVCEGLVCLQDAFCCNGVWDTNCAAAAAAEPECLACCEAECGDSCTFCGDFIVQTERGETCDPPGFPVTSATASTARTLIPSDDRDPAADRMFPTGGGVSCVLIDFEGRGNGVPVGTISGPPDATFGPSWLAVIDSDAGGSGNFANEPTPNTAASFPDLVSDPIDFFDEGVRFVEVFYSATAASLPLTLTAWSGWGGTGVIVGTAEGNTIGTDVDGALCVGDPQGSFCLWDSLQVASANDEISSITLSGAVQNVSSFDNMTFCTGVPATAACCLGAGSCTSTTVESCNSLGGATQGNDATCSSCPTFCRDDCTYCGDGIPDPGEECDDGNHVDGDGCSAVCTLGGLFCGDGVVVPPETCELPGSPTCDCCFEHDSPGCEDSGCESAVCAADSYCCDVLWDTICVETALDEPACETCCDNLCRDDCTYCGDLIINGAPDINEQLVANGDFETGGLAPWTTAEQPGSGGMFLISTPGDVAPLSGATTAPNPGGGSFYAIADQTAPGTHALLQSFTVPAGTISLVLSFEMFVADCGLQAGPIINPVGLDHTAGPNHHARVDILTETALPFDTGAGVVANLYVGVDGFFGVAYTFYYFDLTDTLTPGTTYQLRFADTTNQCVLNQGVDNVMIWASIPGGPLLEECDPPESMLGPPKCDCCFAHDSAGCSDATCEALVCGADPFCCAVLWDASCAADASALPECTACCFPEICTQDCLICVDTDLDGLCDAEDSCPLSPNPGGGAALLGQTIVAPDRTSFAWTFPADVIAVRGDLSLLSSYDVQAVDSYTAATSIPAPEIPPSSGAGFYWLLRPDCDPASYASGGSGECAIGCPSGERDGNLP